MIKASDFKKGDVVKIDNEPHIVEHINVQTPAARGAGTLYKIRLRNLVSKRKIDQVFRGDDGLQEADFERRPVQILFGDSEGWTFMDLQDYSQFTLTREDIEDEMRFLTEELEGITALHSGTHRRDRPSPSGLAQDRRNQPRGQGRIGDLPVQTGHPVHGTRGSGPRIHGQRGNHPHRHADGSFRLEGLR